MEEQTTTRRELRDSVAIAIAVLSAIFTFWQGYEAHEARVDADRAAEQARRDAKDATTLARTDAQAALQLQLDAARKSESQAERSAKAAEASASVATLSLHISERAYVDANVILTSTPKVGEKLGFQAYFSNTGRTPASEVVTENRSGLDLASDTVEHAHSIAFDPRVAMPYTSKSIIPAGGKLQSSWQTLAPFSQAEIDGLTNHRTTLYVFADVTYKDEFNRTHETNYCGFFDTATNTILRCGSLNDAN